MKFSKISGSLRKKNGNWNVDLEFILTFYDCYVREKSIRLVAAAMEMHGVQLARLIEKHPELAQARDMADANRSKSLLSNYVMSNLSPESKKIWEKLTTVDVAEAVEAIFKGKPIRIRQEVFCHAIVHTGYDISKACAMVGVNRQKMEQWKGDPEFLSMFQEVQFHKKNFYEKAYIGLVAEGYPGAIIHANRTVNADRGYREGFEINVTGTPGRVDWDVADLDLDLDTMKKVLAAIEKKKIAVEEEDLAAERHFRSAKRLTSGEVESR